MSFTQRCFIIPQITLYYQTENEGEYHELELKVFVALCSFEIKIIIMSY